MRDLETAPIKDQELQAYFTEIFKNSNKGIQGRGKDRKVVPIRVSTTVPVPDGLPLYTQPPPYSDPACYSYGYGMPPIVDFTSMSDTPQLHTQYAQLLPSNPTSYSHGMPWC